MKLVINISETQYRECIEYKNQKYAPTCKDVDNMFLSIATGTPLPKTNGDIIKALFPNGTLGTNGDEIHVFGVGGNGVWVFSRDWWNAPYKAESGDKK